MKKTILFLILSIGSSAFSIAQKGDSKKYNILFIAVDDLKPYINSLGYTNAITPNLDRLVSSGMAFTSAYCQQAVCGPSRASLLTGLRPDKTQVWDLQTLIRSKNPDIRTLPQQFRMSGYKTIGMGKIFDPRSVDKESDVQSWSEPYKKKFKLAAGYEDLAYEFYQNPAIKAKEKAGLKIKVADQEKSDIKLSTENLDVPDDAYMDGAMANFAIDQLKLLKGSGQPFFLAVGFKKPHLPFVAPSKYWNLYDRNSLPLAAWSQKSKDGPQIAYHNSGELRSFADIEPLGDHASGNGGLLKLSEDKQRELIHGYHACISYIDAQIGKLLDALRNNGLDQNTIVVLWGDHGWHLGDHGLWAKHSNFEQATHVPFIISIPGLTNGKKYVHPVEFVDIYPTLLDLVEIDIPVHLDGKSLLPALKDPSVPVKSSAISQYPRGAGKGAREIMGYSLRNGRYRFTEWIGNHFTTAQPFDPKDVKAIELYDMQQDPNETTNIANDPSMKNVLTQLSGELHAYYASQYLSMQKK